MKTDQRNRVTDLYETKSLTRIERNAFGKWERVVIEMRYRRPVDDLSNGLRIANFIIDLFVLNAVAIVLAVFDDWSSVTLTELLLVSLFPAYYIISEYYFQQTIGKFFTQSIVINEYGDKPDFKTIVVRTFIRIVPFEPLSFLGEKRGWHDKWTNTYVITRGEKEHLDKLLADPENLVP